jgi:hypothetical protein
MTVRRGLLVLLLPLLVALGLGVTAPAAGPSLVVIEPGVPVAGVPVGGMTSEPARQRLHAAFGRPLRFSFGRQRWAVEPWRLGTGAAVDEAVGRALRAPAGSDVAVRVYVAERVVRRYVASLAKPVL